MRRIILFAAACLCSSFTTAQTSDQKAAGRQPPWPLQLEMRVPFEPTVFPSGQYVYLMYELHLTSFMPMPISLSRIEVLDPDAETSKPIATFEGSQLENMLRALGGKTLSDPKDRSVIGDGQTAIVFMSVVFDRGSHVPDRLLHRVTTSYAPEEGAVISTHHTELHVLGPPLEGQTGSQMTVPATIRTIIIGAQLSFLMGTRWTPSATPSTGKRSRTARHFLVIRRTLTPTTPTANQCWRWPTAGSWRQEMAFPKTSRGHGDAFHPAIPITLDTVAGNTITLDLSGQFAYYFHLQPGSLRVKAGDRVRRGQLLASVGASGDAREPHLHFEAHHFAEAAGRRGRALCHRSVRHQKHEGRGNRDTQTRVATRSQRCYVRTPP